jgi:hypothetical protein
MLLQGNLQLVFDALHDLGVIDPVLKMDWTAALEEMPLHSEVLDEVVRVANEFQTDPERLQLELRQFDEQSLSYLAMEVAREYANFHTRASLH